MDFQYKLIVGNQTFYKEFEIPAELERVKLGSTSNCEFRLNSDFFFEDIFDDFVFVLKLVWRKKKIGIYYVAIICTSAEAMYVNYCFQN